MFKLRCLGALVAQPNRRWCGLRPRRHPARLRAVPKWLSLSNPLKERRPGECLSPICLQVSIGGGRLQKSNQLGAVLGRREPTIRLHVVARHDLIGLRDEAVELSRIPHEVRALHSAGVVEVRQRAGFPSNDAVQVRTQAIVTFLGRMAGISRPAISW